MALEIRRIVRLQDELRSVGSKVLSVPLTISVAAAVIKNPFAGEAVADLGILSGEYSSVLGPLLAEQARAGLKREAEVFGKAALVGMAGEVAHGSALIHTKVFGDALRKAANGFAPVTSAEKCGNPGSTIDLSLRFAREPGTLESMSAIHVFSYEFSIRGAPRPDEMVIISVLGDSHRPDWRR
jgi:Amino acid synthesis